MNGSTEPVEKIRTPRSRSVKSEGVLEREATRLSLLHTFALAP